MAAITNLRPNGTPAALLDPEGRAILHLPSELARVMLRADELLSEADMKFNIECPDCSYESGRPVSQRSPPSDLWHMLQGTGDFQRLQKPDFIFKWIGSQPNSPLKEYSYARKKNRCAAQFLP